MKNIQINALSLILLVILSQIFLMNNLCEMYHKDDIIYNHKTGKPSENAVSFLEIFTW